MHTPSGFSACAGMFAAKFGCGLSVSSDTISRGDGQDFDDVQAEFVLEALAQFAEDYELAWGQT